MIFNLILLTLGGILRAVHHIAIYRYDKSWLPQWDYLFGIRRPPLNSSHIYAGLFIVWMLYVFIKTSNWRLFVWNDWDLLIHIVIYFLYFFYIFSLYFHVFLIKKEYRDWSYFIPLIQRAK